MKVLLGTPYPYINQKIWGGVEAVSKNLKVGFDRYEPKTSVTVVSGSTKAKKMYETCDGITYIKQPRMKVGSVFVSQYPFRIKRFLKQNEFDVLNAHEIDFAYYGLEMKHKLLFTLHGFNWEEKKYMAKHKQPFYDFFYVKRLYNTLKKLKYVVSINPYGKELFEHKTNATIFDICNPIPDELFTIANGQQEKRMLCIGNISRMKNLLSLIKAITLVKREIKDVKLVIAGKIEDKEYFNQITAYIDKYNLKRNVEYLGIIAGKQKLEELSKMNFLISTSLNEHAPMVISEAFAAGRPVIASNVGGIPYMVDDGKNGFLIDPTNEQDIADRILHLLENPEQAKAMGSIGKKHAKKHHSLKTVVQRYKSAYDEVAATC